MEPMTALAAVALYRLFRSAISRPHAPPAARGLPAPPAARPAPAERDAIEKYSYPWFTPDRGAVRTTQRGVQAHLAEDPGPSYSLAGVEFPARKFLNKLTLITGRPESGKTAMVRMMMESVGRLFPELEALAQAGGYPGSGAMRWLVVDPTNAFLPFLYQCLPGDVPIERATPMDAGGKRWDIAKDITSDALNEALQDGLFPDSLTRRASDPFWYTKAREITKGLVTVYHDRGSDWQFHDLVVPIKFPQLLKHVLMQSVRTRGIAEAELVGRLGRDIIATSSSVVNRMAIAAALWQHATESFSLRDFLEGKRVLHFAYTPDTIPALSGIANALVHVLVLLGISRLDPHDHTVLWLDEGRYLADVAGLEDIAARGRGAGFGVVYAAQGTPGLVNKWGEGRVKELLDLACTWVALSSGPDTAEAFCRAVGSVEGFQDSVSIGYTRTRGTGVTYPNRPAPGSHGSTSASSSSAFSKSCTTQLVTKQAILPGELTHLPLASALHDEIRGFAFNPELGAFEFVAPFLHHFRGLPAPPFASMPTRPDHQQRLFPWALADLRRLKLDPTPELMAAVKNAWEALERTRP